MKTKPLLLSGNVGQMSLISGQEKILNYIYGNPTVELTVRDLAKKTKISKSTVQRYLNNLRKDGIIGSDYKFLDTWKNKFKKSNFYVNKIVNSGVIDYLSQELVASSIILFGSVWKGDSVASSDIDMFVECARVKEVSLNKYEKILGHKIQLFTRTKITQLPKHLLNNVVNGIKLWGHFTIK